MHSAQTKKGPLNDNIANRTRGQRRPFRSGISVNRGGDRGGAVITPLFYYISTRASGASPSRASGVPRLRAFKAARSPSSRRQKFASAAPEDAPGGHLSSVAARSRR